MLPKSLETFESLLIYETKIFDFIKYFFLTSKYRKCRFMTVTTTLLTFFIAFLLVTKYLYAFSWEQYQAAAHEKLFHLVLCVNRTIRLLIN